MDTKQVEKYEYCKTYLGKLKRWRKELPFSSQHFACRSVSPQIEISLEHIHIEMHEKTKKAISDAIANVEKIIENI